MPCSPTPSVEAQDGRHDHGGRTAAQGGAAALAWPLGHALARLSPVRGGLAQGRQRWRWALSSLTLGVALGASVGACAAPCTPAGPCPTGPAVLPAAAPQPATASITAADRAALAPTGRLRAVINLGNPILAKLDAQGQAAGVSVDLARGLAHELGLPLDLVVVDAAGKSVDEVTQERADIGFFAIDPVRGAGIRFTAPYVLIEGAYLVRQDSPLRSLSEVDVPGRRVVVGQGSAYDLFLSRELKQATILRAPTSPTVVDTFLAERADVAAGVKQQLEADAARLTGLRLLPGHFMVIRQAMGLPKGRGEAAEAVLRDYVTRMARGGFVAEALARHRIEGASVAP